MMITNKSFTTRYIINLRTGTKNSDKKQKIQIGATKFRQETKIHMGATKFRQKQKI